MDLAVKVFLEQVNKQRKESFGLADFCGKAATPTEGSIDEVSVERGGQESVLVIRRRHPVRFRIGRTMMLPGVETAARVGVTSLRLSRLHWCRQQLRCY